jgi:hypothetical protein
METAPFGGQSWREPAAPNQTGAKISLPAWK